ncbi:MAG: DUF3817 domain-containing protein [Planctomycetota bacterium]
MDINQRFLRRIRRLSLIEGISTLVLFFVAMPLKYLADMPLAVRIVGSIHGFLFVGLVVALVVAIKRVPLDQTLAMQGIAAAVVPFGPFWFDAKLKMLKPYSPEEPQL